jgi:uncharacterized membrane protein
MTLIAQLRQRWAWTIDSADRPAYAFIVIWLLCMISLPIGRWLWGDSIIPASVTLAAIAQASAVFAALIASWGWRRALSALVLVGIITWSAEALGSKTDFPFGAYAYTDVLQPQLFGVPLLIPIAWFMLLPAAWALAQLIVGRLDTPLRRLAFILMSAIAFTAWDLFLDPQMVAWDFWRWDNPSGYFGIPWVNYLGWLLTASLATLIVNPARLPRLRFLPFVIIYACVWFLQSLGMALFWNLAAPALFGCLSMGAVMLCAYWRYKVTRSHA